MKKFLAIYIDTAAALEKSGWNKMDEGARQERQEAGIEAGIQWGEEVARNASTILDQGSPLGKTRRASPLGVSDITNSMTGYVILEAESHDAVARLFENHPHFTVFPGDSVEIMKCRPMPAM